MSSNDPIPSPASRWGSDRRRHRRYPTLIACTLVAPPDRVEEAVITDISEAGAAIASPGLRLPFSEGRWVFLRLPGMRSGGLPLEIVRTEEGAMGTLLHAQLFIPDEEQAPELDHLIDASRKDFAIAQRWIASRPDDLVPYRPASPRQLTDAARLRSRDFPLGPTQPRRGGTADRESAG